MNMIITWLHQALLFGTVIMLAAIGETLTEKVGNLNLGTPGTMCVSAAAGVIGVDAYLNSVQEPSVFLCILVAILPAFFTGMLMGLIYSFMTTSLRINQNVVGLVLTIFGTGMAEFLSRYFIKTASGNVSYPFAYAVFSARIPWLSTALGAVSGIFFSYGFMFYFSIFLAIATTLFLNRTRIGLNLRAVGENPGTADAAGISVGRYKYITTCIGSGIVGLAGIYCVMDFKNGVWATTDITTIQAFGWLAVALVIFVTWKPVHLIWGAAVFGIVYWAYQYLPGMLNIAISTDLAQMLPYLITIIVLIVVSLRSKRENQPPASLGIAYFREDR